MSTKTSNILKKICSFQLHVCFTCDFLVDTRYLWVNLTGQTLHRRNNRVLFRLLISSKKLNFATKKPFETFTFNQFLQTHLVLSLSKNLHYWKPMPHKYMYIRNFLYCCLIHFHTILCKNKVFFNNRKQFENIPSQLLSIKISLVNEVTSSGNCLFMIIVALLIWFCNKYVTSASQFEGIFDL